MINYRKQLIILFFIGLEIIFFDNNSYSQPKDKIDWQRDIRFIRSELPLRHKNLFFKTNRDSFETRLAALENFAREGGTGISMVIRLKELIAGMGDSHSGIQMIPFLDRRQGYPFKIEWFADGPYITMASEKYKNIIGKRVLEINHLPWDTVIERLKPLIVIDNQACVFKEIPQFVSIGEILHEKRISVPDSLLITLSDQENSKEDVWIYSQNKLSFNENLIQAEPLRKCLLYSGNKEIFWYHYNTSDSILYFQYNKCWGREMEELYGDKSKAGNWPSFIEATDSILALINSGIVSKLIVDLRFNTGGASPQGSVFAGRIAQNERINQPGKLFVAVGRNTYSSAIINAMDFVKSTHAVIIGEPTAGRPNHYGEVRSFKLPSSGLKIFYSTKYFYTDPGNSTGIIPDVETVMTFDNFISGLDPVYEYVRSATH